MNLSKLAPVVAAMSLLSPAQAQDGPISAKEIQEHWVGKTIVGNSPTGVAVEMMLKADGTATVSVAGKPDTGRWRLTENGYCATWREIRAGKERCFTARRAGSTVLLFGTDGAEAGKFSEIR